MNVNKIKVLLPLSTLALTRCLFKFSREYVIFSRIILTWSKEELEVPDSQGILFKASRILL